MSDDLRKLPVDEFSIRGTLDYYDRHKKLPHTKGACSICDEVRRRRQPVATQLPLGASESRP
jgi:hypothetical protein